MERAQLSRKLVNGVRVWALFYRHGELWSVLGKGVTWIGVEVAQIRVVTGGDRKE